MSVPPTPHHTMLSMRVIAVHEKQILKSHPQHCCIGGAGEVKCKGLCSTVFENQYLFLKGGFANSVYFGAPKHWYLDIRMASPFGPQGFFTVQRIDDYGTMAGHGQHPTAKCSQAFLLHAHSRQRFEIHTVVLTLLKQNFVSTHPHQPLTLKRFHA